MLQRSQVGHCQEACFQRCGSGRCEPWRTRSRAAQGNSTRRCRKAHRWSHRTTSITSKSGVKTLDEARCMVGEERHHVHRVRHSGCFRFRSPVLWGPDSGTVGTGHRDHGNRTPDIWSRTPNPVGAGLRLGGPHSPTRSSRTWDEQSDPAGWRVPAGWCAGPSYAEGTVLQV